MVGLGELKEALKRPGILSAGFFLGNQLGSCRPLSVFQSSDKIILAGFRFFLMSLQEKNSLDFALHRLFP